MKTSMLGSTLAGAAFLILEGCTQANGAFNPVSSSAGPQSYGLSANVAPTSLLMRLKSPDSKTIKGLYVAQGGYGAGDVFAYKENYRKNKKPVCSIPISVPAAVAADASGNMYVGSDPTNYQPPATILVYGPDCGSQIASVSDSYGIPITLVLHGSTWYVGNLKGASGGAGNVAVCSQSAGCYADLTAPASNPLTGELFGAGVDKEGNVYADGYIGTGHNTVLGIFEWPHGQNPGTVISSLSYYDVTHGAGGPLIFDNAGNMIVGGTDEIFVLTGCPSACVTTGPFNIAGGSAGFALNKKGTELYFANGGLGSVDVYTYSGPSAPTYLYSVTNGLNKCCYGVGVPSAVTPVPPNTQ